MIQLVATRDKDSTAQKSGVIYRYKCTQADCEEEYIGELGRTFRDRLKEHLIAPSFIYQHSQAMGHPFSVDCFIIIGGEEHGITRIIKEDMFICVNAPFLNRKLGKYQLPNIWDEVLQDTPSLHLR